MLLYADYENKQKLQALTESKIRYMQLRNHFNKNGRKNMSEDDLRYIVDNYGKIPIEDIAAKVKRTPNTVSTITTQLGLRYVFLKKDEIPLYQLMLCLIGQYTDSYLLYNLLGKYDFPYRTERYYKIVHLPTFFDWYKNHIKLICCHSYIEGSLPIEPDWFLEKAQADKRAYQYMLKRIWTQEEDAYLQKLISERKGYKEISKILKRTGSAIKRRCYDLGIQKPKRFPPKFWTDAELIKLQELWLKGYEPCIIAEEIDKSDRQVISMLERNKYYGIPPQKFCNKTS